MTPEGAFLDEIGDESSDWAGTRVAVAVSGGGDSLALLHVARDWALRCGADLLAVTVDHGLRQGSAEEAEEVARRCAALGVPHTILRWVGWTGQGNLQEQAREARRDLIGRWAVDNNVTEILTGHTMDDQAETVLLRLARGSGVDGLAAMSPVALDRHPTIRRPFLRVTRAALRDWLRARGIDWAEDPSNEDPRFDRVRARAMMGHLSDLGLTRDRLVRTAEHMARARRTLRLAARGFAEAHVRDDRGDLLLERPVLELDRSDSPGRVLAAALRWVGGRPDRRRPRYEDLRRLARALMAGRTATLAGCLVTPAGDGARVTREWRAVQGLRQPLTFDHHLDTWDWRWRLFAPPDAAGALQAAALGEAGLGSCPDWRDTGLPRTSLLASPAIWDGDRLVAAPVAGLGNGWTAEPTGDFPDEVEFG